MAGDQRYSSQHHPPTLALREISQSYANLPVYSNRTAAGHKEKQNRRVLAVTQSPLPRRQTASKTPPPSVAQIRSVQESTTTSKYFSEPAKHSNTTVETVGRTQPSSYSLNKALPPKPVLRFPDSPERRGVIDATEAGSQRLDARFPPLTPRTPTISLTPNTPKTTPESISPRDRRIMDSPAPSFVITPSLLSASDKCPDSPISVEFGIASSTRVQSLSGANMKIEFSGVQNGDGQRNQANKPSVRATSIPSPLTRYDSKTPESPHKRHQSLEYIALQKSSTPSRIPRRSLPGNPVIGSPPSIYSPDIAHSIRSPLRTSTNVSVSRPVIDGRNNHPGSNPQSVTDPVTHTFRDNQNVPDRNKLRRTSKYGYNITECKEARVLIMGESGIQSNFSKKEEANGPGNDLDSPKETFGLSKSTSYTNLSIPKLRRAKKQGELRREQKTRQQAREVYRTAGVKPVPRYKPLPPRISSLSNTVTSMPILKEETEPNEVAEDPKSPQSNHEKGVSPIQELADSKTLESSAIGPSDAEPSGGVRTTIGNATHESTTSLDRRASVDSEGWVKVSGSHLQKNHALASFGNMGKGIKNLSKRVGQIVHSRRLSTPEMSIHVRQDLSIERGQLDSQTHQSIKGNITGQGSSKADETDLHSTNPGQCEKRDVKEAIHGNDKSPSDTSEVQLAALENGQTNSSITDCTSDQIIQETEARYHRLVELARTSDEPLRVLLVQSAEQLAKGLMAIREARIFALMLEQSADRILVTMSRSGNDIITNTEVTP